MDDSDDDDTGMLMECEEEELDACQLQQDHNDYRSEDMDYACNRQQDNNDRPTRSKVNDCAISTMSQAPTSAPMPPIPNMTPVAIRFPGQPQGQVVIMPNMVLAPVTNDAISTNISSAVTVNTPFPHRPIFVRALHPPNHVGGAGRFDYNPTQTIYHHQPFGLPQNQNVHENMFAPGTASTLTKKRSLDVPAESPNKIPALDSGGSPWNRGMGPLYPGEHLINPNDTHRTWNARHTGQAATAMNVSMQLPYANVTVAQTVGNRVLNNPLLMNTTAPVVYSNYHNPSPLRVSNFSDSKGRRNWHTAKPVPASHRPTPATIAVSHAANAMVNRLPTTIPITFPTLPPVLIHGASSVLTTQVPTKEVHPLKTSTTITTTEQAASNQSVTEKPSTSQTAGGTFTNQQLIESMAGCARAAQSDTPVTLNMQGVDKASSFLKKIACHNRNTNKPVSIRHNGIVYKVVATEKFKPDTHRLRNLSGIYPPADDAAPKSSQQNSSSEREQSSNTPSQINFNNRPVPPRNPNRPVSPNQAYIPVPPSQSTIPVVPNQSSIPVVRNPSNRPILPNQSDRPVLSNQSNISVLPNILRRNKSVSPKKLNRPVSTKKHNRPVSQMMSNKQVSPIKVTDISTSFSNELFSPRDVRNENVSSTQNPYVGLSLKRKRSKKPKSNKKTKMVSGSLNELESMYYGEEEGTPTTYDKSKEHVCNVCKKSFRYGYTFAWHLKRHTEAMKSANIDLNDIKRCQHCLRCFKTPFLLQCHIEEQHMLNSEFVCRICEISFGGQQALVSHMDQRHVEKDMPYVCKICNFRTSYPKHFQKHFKWKHPDAKKVACMYCFRMVASAYLYNHLRCHFSSNCSKCRSCKLIFTSKIHHKEHLATAHKPPTKPYQKYVSRQISETAMSHQQCTKKASPKSVIHYGGLCQADGNQSDNVRTYTVKNMKNDLELDIVQSKNHRKFGNKQLCDRCIECGTLIGKLSLHFVKEVNCKLCKFVSACGRSMAKHVIQHHSLRQADKNLTMNKMFDTLCNSSALLFCTCGFSTLSGSRAAAHQLECGRNSTTVCKRNGVITPSLIHKTKYNFVSESKTGKKAQFIESIGLSSMPKHKKTAAKDKITVTQYRKPGMFHSSSSAAEVFEGRTQKTPIDLYAIWKKTRGPFSLAVTPPITNNPEIDDDPLDLSEDAKNEIIRTNVDLVPGWLKESLIENPIAEMCMNPDDIRHGAGTSERDTAGSSSSSTPGDILLAELERRILEKELAILNMKLKIAGDQPDPAVDTLGEATGPVPRPSGSGVTPRVASGVTPQVASGGAERPEGGENPNVNLNPDTTSQLSKTDDRELGDGVDTVILANNVILQENVRPTTTVQTNVDLFSKTNSAVQDISLPMAIDQENVSPRNIDEMNLDV